MRSPYCQQRSQLPQRCSASISRSSDVRDPQSQPPFQIGKLAMDLKTLTMSGTATRPVGLIIRQKDPNNLEMPFDRLGEFITPSELFYIRSHFPTPELDPLAYRLSISGAVRNELSLSYADIRAMPSRTCVATLECAGNSRVFLVPPVP